MIDGSKEVVCSLVKCNRVEEGSKSIQKDFLLLGSLEFLGCCTDVRACLRRACFSELCYG